MTIYSIFSLRGSVTLVMACLMTSMFCHAQSVQRGMCMQYNGKASKTSLGGVEIVAANAGSTVSGAQGDFSLTFKTLKAGNKVSVMRVAKSGYVLFNKEAVDQWYISRSDKPFTIVMCKEEKYREIRNNYERISSESYARQQKSEEQKLLALRKQNKLTEEKYKEKLLKLQNDYETQLENLDAYIDRFARIDLSELTKKENAIIALWQQGKVEEAVKAYEAMNLEEQLDKEIKTIGSLTADKEKLERVAEENRQAALQTYETICRKNDMLYLAGGTENMRKIKESKRIVAFADTTFTKAMIDYVNFLEKDKEYSEALQVAMIAFRNAKEEDDQYMLQLLLGRILTYLGMFARAEEWYQNVYDIYSKRYEDNEVLLTLHAIPTLDGLASLYYIWGQSEKAVDIYSTLSEFKSALRALSGIGYSLDDVGFDLERVVCLLQNYSFDVALDLAYKTKDHLEQLCDDSSKSLECDRYFSSLYSMIASALYQKRQLSEASLYNKKSISILEKKCESHFVEYADDLMNAYNQQGSILRSNHNYQDAIESYTKAISIADTLLNIRPAKNYLIMRSLLGYYSSLAMAYTQLGQYAKSIDVFNKTITSYEAVGYDSDLCKVSYSNALMGLGNAYFYLGNIQKAVEYTKKGLENAEAGYASAPRLYANCYALSLYNYCRSVCVPSGDYSTAESLIKKAISVINKKDVEFYDHYEDAYYMLAYLYQMQGKEKEAEKLVDYGVGQFPHNPYFLDAKGELLMKKGKKKEALAIWEKIIAIDSNWPSYGSDFSKMILNM